MSMLSPEQQQRITILRSKVAAGTVTLAEMQEVVKILRAGRMSAASATSTARKAKAKAEIPDAGGLLSELEGL